MVGRAFVVEPGLFIFNYSSLDAKQEVLELGPWPYNDKSLFLQPWSSTRIDGRNNISAIPVWFHLPKLKLHLGMLAFSVK